ncbi:MAG TPA: two-component regulator propeller domain-containing protein [Chryseolinea sp.]
MPRAYCHTLIVVAIMLGAMPSPAVQAQQPFVPFRHYSSFHGLSHDKVLSIIEDRQGFMWFGTVEGLNRFDGYTFTSFYHKNGDTTSLCDNAAIAMLEDRHGDLWIGTTGGMSRYNRASNDFTSYVPDPSREGSISDGRINQILEDEDGNFWLAFSNGYVDYFNRASGRFQHFLIDKNSLDITSLEFDRQGNLWIGTRIGVVVMNKARQITQHFAHNPADAGSLSHNNVNDLFLDRNGVMWVGSDGGLSRYDRDRKTFSHHRHRADDANSLALDVIRCLGQDHVGRIWVGTENGGLDIFDPVAGRFYHYVNDELDLRSISDNSIYAILRDRHNNIWVGTNSRGICLYDANRKPFVIYQKNLSHQPNLPNNKISAIVEQPGAGLWVGSDGGGVGFFDEAHETFTAYRHDPKDPNSIPSDFVVDLEWDEKAQCLWIATWGAGLGRFDPVTKKCRRFIPREGDSTTLGSDKLWCLYLDNEGTLYIGTLGSGFSMYDRSTSTFSTYSTNDGLREENVVAICRDVNGLLWLGSWGNGVSCFDPVARKFIVRPEALSLKNAESISADSSGRLWMMGNPGFEVYDPVSGAVQHYGDREHVPETTINNFLRDGRGNLWLATNKGMVRYNLAAQKATVYTEDDGLPTSQFYGRPLYASSGRMYLGSVQGLIAFDPDSIKDNTIVPPVLITDLKIFNKSVFADSGESPLQDVISETKEIALSSRYDFISLNFVAFNYSGPEGNHYAYKLQGFDDDWIVADGQRSATYTSLEPGDYVFKVKASNNDGIWNETGTSLTIHILPQWYETLTFKLALGLAIAAAAYGFYRYRVRTIGNQARKLTTIVKERTHELQEMNKDITGKNQLLQDRQQEIEMQNEELKQSGDEILAQRDIVFAQKQKLEEAYTTIAQQNEDIRARNENLEQEVQSRTKELLDYNQQLEQFAFISAHNLRAPVARILGLGNVLNLGAVSPEENVMIYEKMVATARELDRVVRDLNTILEIRKNNESHVTEVLFDEELVLVKRYIEKEIEDTRSVIWADFSDAPRIYSVKPYVESVLQNLLSNAIKYRHPARTPVIRLKTETVNGYIRLTVTDNGLGMNLDMFRNKIFSLYQRFHSHVEGKGLGLYLVKSQILALGGKIEVDSKVDEGTTFKVYFKNRRATLH